MKAHASTFTLLAAFAATTLGELRPVVENLPAVASYAMPGNIEVSRTGGGASIKLNRWGLVDGTWLGFSLVPLNKPTTNAAARGVCMSSGGRIRVIPPQDIPCTGST